jgi:hypothetical protein
MQRGAICPVHHDKLPSYRHKDDVSIKVVEFRVSEAINLDDIKKDLSRLNSVGYCCESPLLSSLSRLHLLEEEKTGMLRDLFLVTSCALIIHSGVVKLEH